MGRIRACHHSCAVGHPVLVGTHLPVLNLAQPPSAPPPSLALVKSWIKCVTFEAELLKPDAGPACGSRFSLGTLLVGRWTRKYSKSGFDLSPEQPSVLDSGLDFSIHHFRFELRRSSRRTWRTFTSEHAQLLRAHQTSALRSPLQALRPPLQAALRPPL